MDIKAMVLADLVADKRLIVELFQKCGREELKFIVSTGFTGGELEPMLLQSMDDDDDDVDVDDDGDNIACLFDSQQVHATYLATEQCITSK